ncbi:MAG: acyl-CoA thioesterase [Ignavibacteriaceae bacterium]|nr:acyl-CoA thioesterase [Ignavibacteriaceae bacterium]
MNSIFETEIAIRPDDIDLNNHVHNTKYLDFVQAARYEQMKNDYKMPMADFHKLGYNWVASSAYIEWKRALLLDDKIIVQARLDYIDGAQCKVNFWIVKKVNKKIAAEGNIIYTMISIKTGRPVRIPKDVIEQFSI